MIGKKSNVGDRAAVRKHERPLTWDTLPFAITPIVTSEDSAAQTRRVSDAPSLRQPRTDVVLQFLEIWSEDGVTAEPEDDMAT